MFGKRIGNAFPDRVLWGTNWPNPNLKDLMPDAGRRAVFTGQKEKIDVSQVGAGLNGIELQDREFVAAIREGRQPNASVAAVLACYQVLHQLARQPGAEVL
jgi:hypothetical protein